MARNIQGAAKRPRISIDVSPQVRRRLRLAAAKRDLTVRQCILDTLEERLGEDLGITEEGLLTMTAKADPLLGALWANEKDAAYDRL
jgi:hypothetical protein